MSRKKKNTMKYRPKNEFRMNDSPIAKGHPAYIFGETETKYKSFGLTSNPSDRERKIKLPDNPNPKDNRSSYIRIKPVTANKKYYSKNTLDWQFSKDDMSIVRSLRKDYKKRVKQRNIKKKK